MEDLKKEFEKGAGQLLNDLYKDGPKAGYQQMGAAFGVVIEWALQKTYHLRLANEHRRLDFERNMKILGESMASIPQQNVIEPAPELAIPALERLSFTGSEELSKLFVNLLHKASDSDTAGEAHPAYLQIIESLSVDEAKILHQLNGLTELHYTGIKVSNPQNGNFVFAHNHLTWINQAHQFITFPENTLTYLSHFVGLGILKDMAPSFKVEAYQYRQLRSNYKDLFEESIEKYRELRPGWNLDWANSYFEITPFGQAFMKTCVPMPIRPTLSFVVQEKPKQTD